MTKTFTGRRAASAPIITIPTITFTESTPLFDNLPKPIASALPAPMESFGQNYGYIITAWGLGGLVGPYIAGAVKDRTGSFSGALMPMAVMLLVAIVLPFITHKPERAPVQTTVPA